jgi:hypothetical protein
MLTLSLNKIKQYSMCKEGPEIIAWFERQYSDEDEIPLSLCLQKFGEVHTTFCLRAIENGQWIALEYGIECVENIRQMFIRQYDCNPLFDLCIGEARGVLRNTSPLDVAKESGKNMEWFCTAHPPVNDKQKKAIKAGLAASRIAYAAYTISQPHTSVDYVLGATEEAAEAAQFPKLEEVFQKKLLEKKIRYYDEKSESPS